MISKSNSVIFDKKTENGYTSDYELAILEKKNQSLFSIYSTDEYGRNIKIELEDKDFSIIKISNYKISDKIYDYQTKRKIEVDHFLKNYMGGDGLKMISKLNNKIVLQSEDKCYLFTMKSDEDSSRFVDSLSSFFIEKGRGDCIFIKDYSTAQRKYLYDHLISLGYPKNYLYRQVTTFGVKK